ncbi:MAG: hypothetical protein ABIP81_08795, partial [Terriglobales bacterium]
YFLGWFLYSLSGGQTDWYLGDPVSTVFLFYLTVSLVFVGYVVSRLFQAGMRTARDGQTLKPFA